MKEEKAKVKEKGKHGCPYTKFTPTTSTNKPPKKFVV